MATYVTLKNAGLPDTQTYVVVLQDGQTLSPEYGRNGWTIVSSTSDPDSSGGTVYGDVVVLYRANTSYRTSMKVLLPDGTISHPAANFTTGAAFDASQWVVDNGSGTGGGGTTDTTARNMATAAQAAADQNTTKLAQILNAAPAELDQFSEALARFLADEAQISGKLNSADAAALYVPASGLLATATAGALTKDKTQPFNAAAGAVTTTPLPALATLNVGDTFGGEKTDSTANTVTIPFANGDTTLTGSTQVQMSMAGTLQLRVTANPAGGKVWKVISHVRSDAAVVAAVTAKVTPSVVVDLANGSPGQRSQTPLFIKSLANPILTVQNSDLGSIQWPDLHFVGDWFADANGVPQRGPFGEWWRCYYSTDHANAVGSGIAMATSASMTPEDGTPWVNRGVVFHDTTGSFGEFQTETEKILFVPDAPAGPSLYMYYHRLLGVDGGAGEVVKLATMTIAQAAVAEQWTIHPAGNTPGEVLDTQRDGATSWPGQPLFGYFRPFRFGGDFLAHTLIAGGPPTAFALMRSPNGLPGTWSIDGRPLYQQANVLEDTQSRWNPTSHQVAWNSGQVVVWKGRLMWVGNLMANSAGAGTPSYTVPVAAMISSDFRRLISDPVPVLPAARQAWEPDFGVAGMLDGRGASSVNVGPDGKLRLAYQGMGGIHPPVNPATAKAAAGAFGLAVAA